MDNTEPTPWQLKADVGGLVSLDPGDDRPVLRAALEDCAETLSPAGAAPALSNYWVDRLLKLAAVTEHGDIARGNLWVLTANDGVVEVRMDVDPSDSDPLELVDADDLIRGLDLLRSEVLDRLGQGHRLEDRHWSQKNPG